MAKKQTFPVKEFRLPGGTANEQARWLAIREAVGRASGTSKAKAESATVRRAETASGSNKVSFFMLDLSNPAPKSRTASKRVLKELRKVAGPTTRVAARKPLLLKPGAAPVVAPVKKGAPRKTQKSG